MSEDLAILGLTLSAALASTALILPAGVAAAWALSRWRGAGRSWVETLLSLPLVLPRTAIGLLLLQLFAARGPLGRLLDALDIIERAGGSDTAALRVGKLATTSLRAMCLRVR